MERVTVSRTLEAAPGDVRSAISDLEPFMRAAGFDAVAVDGDTVTIQNRVGLFEVELVVEVLEDPDCELTYEQRDGIFEEMRTEYRVEERADGTAVEAVTTFEAVDLPVVGQVLDATVVKRQRRKELNEQFDWLAERVA